jgi:sporulation protein YlmC with PRC-barrel domain
MVTTMQRAPMTEHGTTSSLIASDRVEGTAVYDAHGKRIGKVERLVIDKASGRVAYAVLSFGGLLGIGADHYPIPWPMLDYDEKLGGYRVDFTEAQLPPSKTKPEKRRCSRKGLSHPASKDGCVMSTGATPQISR